MHVIGLPYLNCRILFLNSQLLHSDFSFNYIFLHEIMDRARTEAKHSYGSIFNKKILWLHEKFFEKGRFNHDLREHSAQDEYEEGKAFLLGKCSNYHAAD